MSTGLRTGLSSGATMTCTTGMAAWSNSHMCSLGFPLMYELLCSLENLEAAFRKARVGKTRKHYVLAFEKDLRDNLFQLHKELVGQTYQPRPLKTFIIKDPKTRKISKSRFRDRIVHHALINIIGPVFQKKFIYDSHANQLGKGTLKAVQRFDTFKRKASRNNTRTCHVLKADIRHYFEEVDHTILMSIIRKHVTDKQVLWLIEQIISNTAHRGGGANGFRRV